MQQAEKTDKLEVRRGRPKMRMDTPSNLHVRVKSGGEIRSYNRRKANESNPETG